jgi:amidohydrolase
MHLDEAKAWVTAAIDRQAGLLVEVAHDLHGHPELAFEEHHAHDVLAGALDDAGLAPVRHHLDVPTAFVAEAGSSGPLVAVLLEYDALPELGHACGHNIIAAAGLGAGLALGALATTGDPIAGRVRILGTPAEEGGGGKIVLADRGAFGEVDAALMVHPADSDLAAMTTLAIEQLEATYHGLSAHAAAAPWKGANALDAAVLGYQNVAALRQHIAPDERVHGVFTHGGDKPNIVPSRAATFWYVRSGTVARLAELKARVETCLRAGADAAGCRVELRWGDRPTAYADLKANAPLDAAWAANATRVGRTVLDPRLTHPVLGSTDMGNVSYLVPSIHPMIAVAPAGVPIHSAAFAEHARSDAADRAVLDGAKLLALTALDVWADAAVRTAAHAAFART